MNDHFLYGKCLSFVMPECIIKAKPYVIYLKFNVDALLFLHQNNDYHGADLIGGLEVTKPKVRVSGQNNL